MNLIDESVKFANEQTNEVNAEEQFQLLLRRELLKRCEKNPAYSLRAFARHLGVSHPALSQVLSGKRKLTKKATQKIVLGLGLSLSDYKKIDKTHSIFSERFSHLDFETYETVSDWYYDAILELTKLKHFRGDAKWIAKALSINIHQANAAIERLQSVGLLEIKNDEWHDVSANNTNNHLGDVSKPALKKYQKDLLQKSATAVDDIEREFRDHTSLTLTFSKKDIKKAKELIKKFRTEFSQMNAVSKNKKDEVYTLQVSFFPLSETDKDN